ncbi:MAG: SH3 domain-containing protein [Anaerolineae bacterium]|nr:SH3 domain-containing protein [Anaerolineae bacterium]
MPVSVKAGPQAKGKGKSRVLAALAALAGAALACNVQLGGTVRAPLGTPSASVVFLAPANNSVIAQGSTITLAVTAQDSGPGVAKIDILVDGVLLESVAAPVEGGQSSLTAHVDWEASGVQGHLITAEAQRADGTPLGEAGVAVTVVEVSGPDATLIAALPTQNTPEPTPTRRPPSPTPDAPANTATPAPTLTPSITPTVAGVAPTLRVTFDFLNIRAGPGTEYPQIGRMNNGETARIVGRNADRTWIVVEFGPVRGWVTSNPNFSEISGDTTNIPLVAAPAAPAATPTLQLVQPLAPTSTVGTVADLVIDRWVFTPETPNVNQTFFVTIVVRNQGALDAPASLLTGVFQPGNERSDMAVPPLRAGESVTLPPLYVTLRSAGPNQSGTLTLDVQNEVEEGPVGEANNVVTITYNVN